MAEFEIQCFNADGSLAFNAELKTVRHQSLRYIPAGASGEIPLSQLPNGIHGVRFEPVSNKSNDGVAPYTFVENGVLKYRGGIGDFYLIVLGITQ